MQLEEPKSPLSDIPDEDVIATMGAGSPSSAHGGLSAGAVFEGPEAVAPEGHPINTAPGSDTDGAAMKVPLAYKLHPWRFQRTHHTVQA